MVRLLQLGALGLALCGISTAVALPQTDDAATTDSAGKPGPPKPPACKGLTKREEWYVSRLPQLQPQRHQANN